MKNIVIGFSTRRGLLSWLIRTVTKSKVSHAYVRIPVPEYETSMIFQASGLSVNYCSGELFDSKNLIHQEYEVAVSDEQAKIAERLRVSESGKSYSMNQLYGFLWVLALRKFGKKVHNPFSDGNHSYVCVEIAADQVGHLDGENMTPEDFRRWCEKNGKLIN
jgi:hypothetical protein